jgi:nitroreductase
MDVYAAMAARKTIRDFSPRPIEPERVQKILAAGFFAPTNNHLREWHFVSLQDLEKRKELLDRVIHPVGKKGAVGIVNRWGLKEDSQREMYIEAIPRQFSMLMSAACLFLPCYHQPGALLEPKDLSALNSFASIWCCIENILVAAAAEGIFGVTRIPFEEERKTLKECLHIPINYEIPCYLALGYPAEGAQRARQVEIDPQTRLHTDDW